MSASRLFGTQVQLVATRGKTGHRKRAAQPLAPDAQAEPSHSGADTSLSRPSHQANASAAQPVTQADSSAPPRDLDTELAKSRGFTKKRKNNAGPVPDEVAHDAIADAGSKRKARAESDKQAQQQADASGHAASHAAQSAAQRFGKEQRKVKQDAQQGAAHCAYSARAFVPAVQRAASVTCNAVACQNVCI